MSSGKEPPHVVIIGAGIGGLTMGIKLRRMGFSNFTIIEKAGEVGGTWRDNIYPGCSSDVPIHVYSLSTDLNPNWTHSHAFQPDIQQYWLQLAHKYELYSNIIFHRTVTSAEWDPRTQKYNILTRDRDGNKIPLSAAILVSATGLLEVPKFPDFPGVSQFRGHTFHSARWDSAVSLEGKRVAVIGGGPSAIQFVPIISQDPSVKIVQYCRSPNWIHPSVRQEYSPTQKWLFRHVPLYLRLFRDFLFFRAELMYLLIFGSHATNASIEQKVKAYMVKNTPTRYLNEIIPDYKLGSKRIVYDWNYLAALVRPNLTLVRDPIVSITENGICTKEGAEAAFDVIIFSTGYITDKYPIYIKGRTEQTVAEYYEAQGGPTAYLGTTLPGFPNFFTISGANTATGYASLLFGEEVQVAYILQMIKPVIGGDILSLEVTAEATNVYNREIQARLAGFGWSRCVSWYRTGGTGKIHALFPGSMTLFWWWLRAPNWTHYKVVTVGRWKPRGRFGPFLCGISAAVGLCLTVGVAGVAYLGWAQMSI